jgi:hypothetical protein
MTGSPLQEKPRTLTSRAVSADVAHMHRALLAIGIEIADEEQGTQLFEPSMSVAATRLRTVSGLEPTGVFDAATVELAQAALDRLERRVPTMSPAALDANEGIVEGTSLARTVAVAGLLGWAPWI